MSGSRAATAIQPLSTVPCLLASAGSMPGHCLVLLPAVAAGGNDRFEAADDVPAADVTLSDTWPAVTLRTQQKTVPYV